jgi:hypothetical protein
LSRSHSLVLGDGGGVEVFCGVDVARETHHAVALDRAGRRLVDRPLPNDETALRDLFTELAERGRLLVVVDQPASIGALAIAVARSMGVQIGYLPGLAMRRIADLYPGEGKTDARDAFVIADAGPDAAARAAPGRPGRADRDRAGCVGRL